MKQLPELLTVQQVADYLQVSVPTVRRMVSEGSIRSVKIGRVRRIQKEALVELIEAGTESNSGERPKNTK